MVTKKMILFLTVISIISFRVRMAYGLRTAYCKILFGSADERVLNAAGCSSGESIPRLCEGILPVGFGVKSCDPGSEPSGLDLSYFGLKGKRFL